MVRPPPTTQRSEVLVALLCVGLLVALQVAAKSSRDALICAAFSSNELPRVMALGAVLAGLFAFSMARAFRAFGPARVVPILLLLNSVALGAEYIALPSASRAVALILYLHVTAVGAVVVSGFWSITSERFDPHTLRTSMARIGLGATFGGLLGGLFAERIATLVGSRGTLMGLAALSLLGVFAVRGLVAGTPSIRRPPAPASPEKGKLGTPYLWRIAWFVGLTALTSSVVDFAFKARAIERFASAEELVPFFALFYTTMNFVAFVVQAFITPRLLDREGLEVGLAALPVTLAAAGLGALIAPGLTAQGLLRGVDGALTSSLFRSAYEPLYTPLSADRRRSSKAVIDVVVDKFGDATGSLLAWALVLIVPGAAVLGATALAVAAALLTLVMAVRLHHGYIGELASSLRTGSVTLDDSDVRDQTTRLTLSRTQMELDRERLLAQIQELREKGQLAPSTPPDKASAASGVPSHHEENDPSARLLDLVSREPRRLTRALAEPATDVRWVGFMLPLLGRDDVGGDVMNALAAFGERITGQLSDALLDHEHSAPKVRRRIARILGSSGGARAALALQAALLDPELDVRLQVARGLLALRRRGVATTLDRAAVLELVAGDLRVGSDGPVAQRLEYAFTLLGLVQDPEAFELAHRALSGTDQKLRGTALEYLSNVLPDSVMRALQSLIRSQPSPGARRGQGELLAELKRTLG